MPLDTLIYSTELINKREAVPIVYSKRANAPERGSVFTAKVLPSKNCNSEIKLQEGGYKVYSSGKQDFLLNCFENYTGYVKKNYEKPGLEVEVGKYYRFAIVAGPYTKERHNFYYAVPLRKLGEYETDKKNVIGAQTYILIQRLGEFLLGIRFNRDKTISSLKKSKEIGVGFARILCNRIFNKWVLV